MKRLLSAILVLTMILALVPAVMAAGEIQEQELEIMQTTNLTTVFKNPNDTATLTVDNGTASLTNMQVRRYAVTGANGPLLAFVFTAANTGEYILEFKTDATGIANKATAAAPGVYIVNGRIGSNTAFKGITGNDWVEGTLSQNGLVGYFDFSELTEADEFVPMTLGTDGELSDEPVKVSLKKGSNYTIALFCDGKSVELNPKTAFDTLTSADYIVNKDGIRTPTNSAIDAKHKQNIYISGVRLTPYVEEPEEDKALTDAFNPTPSDVPTQYNPSVEPLKYVNGAESTVEAISVSATDTDGDGIYNVSTSTTDNTYKFLYWVKGKSTSKIIVSRNASFDYTPGNGDVNYLIAVYEKDGEAADKAEFFNANGQLIAKLETDGEAPALPSMAGYGTAKAWVGKDGTRLAAEDAVTVSGTAMYIAEYAEPTTTYSIETTKCETDKTSYKYGDLVTCTATGTAEDGTFKCWKRDGEIVSTNPTYTFSAWKNHEVEAVYVNDDFTFNGVARKIVLEIFGDNVMAEFIGFTNVVEKGIILGTQEIAMTTGKTQFTVENNVNATTAKGYVIVKNGDNTYTKYTDGEISLPSNLE